MKRVLMVGYGDIAQRASKQLEGAFDVIPVGRRYGFDLDRPETLKLEGAEAVLHCAPPAPEGERDTRTAHLLGALEKARILPSRMVYVSTSGVYGDCGGARVDEDHPVAPITLRGKRRADAERSLAQWCAAHGARLVILRAPGIYAADRLPIERLRAGTPALREEDDVYTNHIHADDLAAAAVRALDVEAPPGIYNASDDSELKMGEWFDLVAARVGLPRPPRIPRAQIAARVSPELLTFMSESRRLDNRRLKQVLGLRLRYPTVEHGLADLAVSPLRVQGEEASL